MIRVAWLRARTLCMDQHLLDGLLAGPEFVHEVHDDFVPWHPGDGGAVVVVPARYFTPAEVTAAIAALPWCVLVLTSDEESTFDHTAVVHPQVRTWVMTPRPGVHEPGGRYLGEGCHASTSPILAGMGRPAFRNHDVVFRGQVTHEHRVAMMDAVAALPATLDVDVEATESFMAGRPLPEYLAALTNARVALCPSGPATPDSFRLYEALEAGCVPIVEDRCPGWPEGGYWSLLYPQGVPFPVVSDWGDELAKTVEHVLADWEPLATRCQAWWLQQKRRIFHGLVDDVADLSGYDPRAGEHDALTVLVPTSPTSRSWRNAATDTEQVLDSVAARTTGEILVLCDGVRAEQEHLRDEYERYLADLVWSCAHEYGATPLVFDHHAHQANTTRRALELVRTPLVLFVEHDTPLVGEIPLDDLGALVRSGFANLVRLHHETHVLEPHRHLMLDRTPRTLGHMAMENPVPFLRTVQWSQRPHLASTGFYRHIIGSFFGTQSRTMIEDVMHGVVQDAWNRYGIAGWEAFRLVMYAPPGDMQRSTHLDGRGDDPKFPMRYAYDGDVPPGAPAPPRCNCGHLVAEHNANGCLHPVGDDLERTTLCRCSEHAP